MKPIAEMSQAELAAYVQSSLREKGIEVVLSGGAAVVIYSDGEYVSVDIDFVNAQFAGAQDIKNAMSELGFKKKNRHFEHPDSQYYVEFPPGPLAIGDWRIEGRSEIRFDTGKLRVLSATECVMDRLAHYYHWGDRQALTQAEMVASRNRINLDEVMQWSKSEGKLEVFHYIRDRLKPR